MRLVTDGFEFMQTTGKTVADTTGGHSTMSFFEPAQLSAGEG
jgi:hypothetical protein